MVLLEALVAAVGNDTDASLRDYAAKVRLHDLSRDSELIIDRLCVGSVWPNSSAGP